MIILRREDFYKILKDYNLDLIKAGPIWCEVKNTPGLVEFLDKMKYPYSIV